MLKERNLPTIYVTHFEQDVYALADRISILYNGNVLYDNTFNAVLHFKTRTPFHFDLRFLAQRAITLKELLHILVVGSQYSNITRRRFRFLEIIHSDQMSVF